MTTTETKTAAETVQPAAPSTGLEPAPASEIPAPAEDRLAMTGLMADVLQTALAKKRLFYARLSAAFLALAAFALVWMAGRVLPQVESTLGSANSALQSVDIVAQQLAGADIPAILDNLDQTLLEGRESIAEASDALQQVSEIDFDGLNQAILDLQKVLENPLGSLMGGFRRS